MGKPEKYEPAHQQLRRLLAEAREEGLSFDDAWERAIRPGAKKLVTTEDPIEDRPDDCVVWPKDTDSRRLIRTAVLEGMESWRRCYCLEPVTPAERALVQLASELRLDRDEPVEALVSG